MPNQVSDHYHAVRVSDLTQALEKITQVIMETIFEIPWKEARPKQLERMPQWNQFFFVP
jgi:hypothetical protein